MTTIAPDKIHPTDFERFVVEYHPDVFIEWEQTASQSYDLDYWVEGEYYEIIEEYEELVG